MGYTLDRAKQVRQITSMRLCSHSPAEQRTISQYRLRGQRSADCDTSLPAGIQPHTSVFLHCGWNYSKRHGILVRENNALGETSFKMHSKRSGMASSCERPLVVPGADAVAGMKRGTTLRLGKVRRSPSRHAYPSRNRHNATASLDITSEASDAAAPDQDYAQTGAGRPAAQSRNKSPPSALDCYTTVDVCANRAAMGSKLGRMPMSVSRNEGLPPPDESAKTAAGSNCRTDVGQSGSGRGRTMCRLRNKFCGKKRGDQRYASIDFSRKV